MVRNNATRALGAWRRRNSGCARYSGGSVVEMLSSGIWTDRNKGLMVLNS